MATIAQHAKSTHKRDRLVEIEKMIQANWAANKTFESNPDHKEASGDQKFMATFPFPYMNGRLHLGHSFTLSKAEFAVGFEQLRGKNTLFPLAFHCTGMPIKACADKIAFELKNGSPIDEKDASSRSIKSKVLSKTGNESSQIKIMESMGISREDVPKFADPNHWIEYFPPLAIDDLKRFGLKVDWRRSFITTDKNPYFDSFVRWQFNRLKEKNLVRFGKRYTIISPRDSQPCQDHDRASGEGINPQEYTALLFKVKPDASLASKVLMDLLDDASGVYLIAATLRPETLYGLTNIWAASDVQYVAFRHVNGWIGICTERALHNGAYQGWTASNGTYDIICHIPGSKLMGVGVEPLLPSDYSTVFVLPFLNLLPDKGTGIVASVPSDSPDDYAALYDLQQKPGLRAKFMITDEMVLPFQPIGIIQTQGYATPLLASELCATFNIRSQNDKEGLAKAKAAAYKDGFYNGIMLVGPHAGKSVGEAKPLIKADLIATGKAIPYAEPEGKVVARTGDICLVALMDQWYIPYGEPEWRQEVVKMLSTMELFHEEARHQMNFIVDWLGQWACARSFGLGSRLPWDTNFLVESLSDSTIYMAYYTIAHFLQNDTLDGASDNPKVSPVQMTDEVWSYLFDGKKDSLPPAQTDISGALLLKMKEEFLYWYPMDLRVSGKDLLFNHLIFMLYIHAAIFPESCWPRGIRVNGHLLLNAQKMSKSTGNFMTLAEAISTFSADATRFTLADAGDTLDDANFSMETANAAILKLHTLLEWIESVFTGTISDVSRNDATEALNLFDQIMLARIDECIHKAYAAYDKMLYRDALKWSFHELLNARDRYREVCSTGVKCGMHKMVIDRFIHIVALLMYPITTHFSEYLLMKREKKDHLSVRPKWPDVFFKDEYISLLAIDSYASTLEHRIRIAFGACKKKEDAVAIIVAREVPVWQKIIMDILEPLYVADGVRKWREEDSAIISKVNSSLKTNVSLPKEILKKVIPWMIELKKKVEGEGVSAFKKALLFDELEALCTFLPHLKTAVPSVTISVFTVDRLINECHGTFWAEKSMLAIPGEPAIICYASEKHPSVSASDLADKLLGLMK